MDEIQSIDWALLFSCNSDPSCMFDTFYSKISEFIDIHIPLKQLSKKESKLKSNHGLLLQLEPLKNKKISFTRNSSRPNHLIARLNSRFTGIS